jgi:molybdate transport system regulatory protein
MLSGIDLEHVLDDTGDSMQRHTTPAPQDTGEPNFLTVEQVGRLDAAFDAWVAKAKGKRSVISRNRTRLVFLLLRYTGAKLGEILALDDRTDFVLAYRKVLLGGGKGEDARPRREVYLPGELHAELKQLLRDPDYAALRGEVFHLDQGYMRRVIYERAEECGLPKHLANPNTLRRSRAVELLHNGVPLTVVQRILGHQTANSTAAFLDLPEEEQKRLEKYFLERENRRTTGVSNTFFGRVSAVHPGEIQSRVEMTTLGGHVLVSIMSSKSVEALGLREGVFVTARLKAPAVALDSAQDEPPKSGENTFHGVVEQVHRGRNGAEVVLTLDDGSKLCSTMSLDALFETKLGPGDGVWATADPFSIILNVG